MATILDKVGNAIENTLPSLLTDSNFINRSIGMSNSYEDIMFIVQSLGHEPISLLGKDYLYIFDHVRRNYNMGTNVMDAFHDGCPKFTFYKSTDKPTVRFANPYDDPKNLMGVSAEGNVWQWKPDVLFNATIGPRTLYSYAESDDEYTNNKAIETQTDNENANTGINFGQIASFSNSMNGCDLLKKTNDNFNHGRYRTLIARFHTTAQDTKDMDNPLQTANSKQYGMSHGRNLLKITPSKHNGYDNPYCRVWTYHHQYNQLARAIRPFDGVYTQEGLEEQERGGGKSVGFRTIDNKDFGFKGGSARLDQYGVMDYRANLVNIAPTAKLKDYFFKGRADTETTIKKCMFSIENLAWRTDNIRMDEYDEYGLSPEQKGPLGGRIMWFPPYDIAFNEDVNVNWNANQFIGRGERVYTYTDTERRGNLSFTLLIDHPSILDYWSGRDENGMKNKGKQLSKGNDGGVDNKDNQENTLLRFFAGCDVLTAKPQEYKKHKREVEKTVNPTVPPPPEVHKPPTKKVIHCVLYYPNNYSGVDDMPTKISEVNAVYYLMNGIGAQKYISPTDDKAYDIPTEIDNRCKVVNIDERPENEQHSGYEINGNISITTEPLMPLYGVIETTYASNKKPVEKNGGQCLTDKEGNRLFAMYGENKYKLAKQVGSQALPLSAAKVRANLVNKPHQWYRRRWYYRVDKAYENQRLSTKESYIDTECYYLNGEGYKNLLNETNIAKAFGIGENTDNVMLISFADMFVALEGDKARKIVGASNIDETNVQTVMAIMNNKDRYNITSVKFEGHASYQGYAQSNDTLSNNRAMTFKKWMEANNFPNVSSATAGTKKASPANNVDKGNNSKLQVKLWRSASVIIEYEESDVETASLADKGSVQVVENESGETVAMNKVDKYSNNPLMKGLNNYLATQEGIQSKIDQEKEYDNLTPNTVERYDNEGEFFKRLKLEDPFLHNLVADKIKYFDPAFHSISPEGFNARLTFLHQCTRQGSTVGGNDSQVGTTAYNLAFGRPPVCVLRLGDFYYTKIIINSIGINYESPQWDLNPEGIGVMPMFAKVNIGFVFLGGSDLAGPISRLQNAVSFNYYANTSVYDNRAEMVQYDESGNGREVKFKPYVYPTMLHTNGEIKRNTVVNPGDAKAASVEGDNKTQMIGNTNI